MNVDNSCDLKRMKCDVEQAGVTGPSTNPALSLRLFREMVRTRTFDEQALLLQRTGRIPFYYPCAGQEAHVAVALALADSDWIFVQFREQGVRLARGVPVSQELALWRGLGSAAYDPVQFRISPLCVTIATALPHATGYGYGARFLGRTDVAVAVFGDGGTSEGDFHAALNAAGVWKTPTVFFCQNNLYAQSTPLAQQTASRTLADKAVAYGIEGQQIDGMDVFAVYEAVRLAVRRAREGGGSTLIESLCYRYASHSTYDGVPVYRTRDEEAAWRHRDPIDRLRGQLVANGYLAPGVEDGIRAEMKSEIDAAITSLEQTDVPGSAMVIANTFAAIPPRVVRGLQEEEEALQQPPATFAPGRVFTPEEEVPASGETKALTLVEALNLALLDGMQRHSNMVILGEDVGREGGIFRVTAGLYERFGKERVLDTPLSEVCIAGSAVGMAIAGVRPVCEIEFAGFSYSAFDQIVFHVARYAWRTNGKLRLPIVVRMPAGGGHEGMEGHSDSPEAHYAHAPGALIIIYPSNPYDAKGLLASALDSDEAVLFFEPIARYFERQPDIPVGHYKVPIGRARITRPGTDVTIVSYGNAVLTSLQAANELASAGVSAEVIDLRTLKPWDEDTVLESVGRTGRLIVVHEAPLSGGLGAEIVATVCERAGDLLEVPPARVAHLDIPWGAAKLEVNSVLRPARIAAAARRLMAG
jgi:2-oxoisovalerate dehydrogenase E1 component